MKGFIIFSFYSSLQFGFQSFLKTILEAAQKDKIY